MQANFISPIGEISQGQELLVPACDSTIYKKYLEMLDTLWSVVGDNWYRNRLPNDSSYLSQPPLQ